MNATQLNEPGPQITPAEWSAFQDVHEGLLPSVSAVALCESLPPGVPVGTYADLIHTERAADVPGLLDTTGEPWRHSARPAPTRSSRTPVNSPTPTSGRRRPGTPAGRGARAVVASLSPDGLLAVTPESLWRQSRRPASGAINGRLQTRRSRTCRRTWPTESRGRTISPAPPPCPRRPYWRPWQASSTGQPMKSCSAGSR